MDLHSSSNFLNKDNIETLWEVLSESPMVSKLPSAQQSQMQQHMVQQMRAFFNKEGANPSYDLMTLNKRFLELALRNMNAPSAITPPPTTKYTSQQIQEARQTQFEKQYNKKKEEFTDAITLRPPPTPTFADKKDEPISEMEQLIANMVAQRNFEMDEITKRISSNAQANPNFLKATDTSIKTEKQEGKENVMKQLTMDTTRFIESPALGANNEIKRITINEELNETHYYENIGPPQVPLQPQHQPQPQPQPPPIQKMATSINNLFSKLKKAPISTDPVQTQLDAIHNRMDELQQQMELIIKRLDQMQGHP